MKATLFALLIAVSTLAASAQDVVTVGSATATGSTVDIPVYIRDVSGTPLGVDKPAGSHIQSFSIKVSYSPAAAVSSVTFTRAGITANLTPTSEFNPSSAGAISLLDTFQESTNPIPFTLNAQAPGNQVAHLVFTLSSSATPQSTITLTLDPATTQLTDQGGSAATKESSGNGLSLVNGTITVPPLSLQLTPPSQSIVVGSTGFITVTASSNVASNTTVTLSSGSPSTATVPASVTINAGTKFTSFAVTGVAVGASSITASLPQSLGGAQASASVSITAPPPNCPVPAAPQISVAATANSGQAYIVTWPAVTNASEYDIDESTDENFGNVTSQTVTVTSASFTHTGDNVRYYYRVRARNHTSPCNVVSGYSAPLSVLITVVKPPEMRVLPVVGTITGSANSFFRTSVQLYNPKSVAVSGRIVYHPQSVSGTANDPSIAYSIQPKKTLVYADLLPAMGITSGVGSADLIADTNSALPLTLVRVFNDAGVLGTTGLAEEQFATSSALQAGSTSALIAPADMQRFRLNIGVRTLDQGAAMNITVRDKDGNTVKTLTKSFGGTFFTQISSVLFLDNYVLVGGETITIDVTSGSAFVYGATTDNTTNDPSVQFAGPIQ